MAQKKATPAKKLSFGEAVTEVEEILADLEAETVDIDQLGDRVKRAAELIQVCREKLEKTDKEVRDVVAGLNPEREAAAEPASAPAVAPGEGETEDGLPF